MRSSPATGALRRRGPRDSPRRWRFPCAASSPDRARSSILPANAGRDGGGPRASTSRCPDLRRGFGGGFPSSLMGTIAYIRQIYLDVDQYKMAKSVCTQNRAASAARVRPRFGRRDRVATHPVTGGAGRRDDRMIRFGRGLKQPLSCTAGTSISRGGILKEAGVPALVSLKWPEKSRGPRSGLIETMHMLRRRDQRAQRPCRAGESGRAIRVLHGWRGHPARGHASRQEVD